MSEPRSYGHGSVYRQSVDGRYVAAFRDPVTGKRVKRYARTAAEARRLLRQMTTRTDTGQIAKDSGIRVEAYVEAWLSTASRDRAGSTVYEYRSRLSVHILPALGSRRLSDLTVRDVERVFDRMLDSGKSLATVRGTRNAFAAVLSSAVEERLLAVNVARAAKLPKAIVEEDEEAEGVQPPDLEAARRLLEATAGTQLGRILVVAAGTGARIGEILSARFEDLDLDAGLWTVRATVTRGEDGRQIVQPRTKTRSRRTVPLSGWVVETLREQRRTVVESRLAASWWIPDDPGFVFPTSIGTTIDPRNLRKELRPIAESVGYESSFHGFRHLAASLAIADDQSIEALAKALGHARTSTTTDLYGWLVPTRRTRSVGEAIADAYRSGS